MGRKPAKAKSKIKRPVARKPPKGEDSTVRDLAKRLAEALDQLQTRTHELDDGREQRTATADILRVISRSPSDVQPVFNTITTSARALTGAQACGVFLLHNDIVSIAAHDSWTDEWRQEYPRVVSANTVTGRAMLEQTTVHVTDLETNPDYEGAPGRRVGIRTVLAVPMLKEGQTIGAIGVWRTEVKSFSGQQIALLQTFVDQAVIAIENVRLFNETKEALERQTATSEILRVISSSPTDIQPVFDAIVRSTLRLCGATFAVAYRYDGDKLYVVAHENLTAAMLAELNARYPQPPSRETATGVSVLEARIVHIPDPSGDDVPPASREFARQQGWGSMLAVPLLRSGRPVGNIAVSRVGRGPFSEQQLALVQMFADQAVIAIENVRLLNETKEALERQTATAEILRVISESPTDVHPVFQAIAERARQLCKAQVGATTRLEGELVHLAGVDGPSAQAEQAMRAFFPVERQLAPANIRHALAQREPYQITDVRLEPGYPDVAAAERMGVRSILSVPLLHEGRVIGTIGVARDEPGRFSDEAVALLQTFSRQAVIAIENVRLFNETKDALDQQTATAEILRIISRSPTDVQPVFDTIVRNAVRLCGAIHGGVYTFDGEMIHARANDGYAPEQLEHWRSTFPRPVTAGSVVAQAIRSNSVVLIDDLETAATFEVSRETLANLRARGSRSLLAVPMSRNNEVIGAIALAHGRVGAFADAHVELLTTFADQAVIAIENVRLFKELEEKNRALTQAHAQVSEALERQTATADILRVISVSQAEVQPVFDAIVDSAMRVFRAWAASAFRLDGHLIHLIVARGGLPGSESELQGRSPWPIQGTNAVARCIAERTVIHIADTESDPSVDQAARDLARRRGWRSVLGAPMLRDGQPVGAITVTRAEAGSFSPAEIELLQTFADQAVIAIENARLLSELQARTADLTHSVEQLTALGEVSHALSSTLDLKTVLTTIVGRASQLAGTNACTVYEYDDATGEFHWRASANPDEEVEAVARRTAIPRGVGAQGRMAVTRAPVQIPDISATDAYHGPLRDVLLRTGTRAILAVPLLRDDQLVGGLTVNRKTPGEFPPEVVALLKTFATQSALAILNARLFREIEDKSRQLEAASRHKSEFLANMSHELRTPLNAIIGFSEVLAERMFGELNEKQDEYLKDIHASGQHLLSLINDILDLSKIEAGRMELEPTEFDLPTTIDNGLTLIRERATRHGIALHHEVDARLGRIRGDERKLKQVLLNLLSNAIKFTPEGGRIDVQARLVDGMAEVAVADTGVGIAPEDQEAVFEEFRQVGTADKKVEGTGLGLTLSRKFVELHGGRIWVTSQVGTGSTFTFTIPVRRGA